MELGRRDHLRQLFHVGRLDVHNVEALILDVQIPEVNAQVVATDERLAITVDRDTVDMVRMSIGISPAGHGGDDGVVVSKARKPQVAGRVEVGLSQSPRSTSAAAQVRRSEIVGEIILRYDLQGLLEHLPQLDRLVVG